MALSLETAAEHHRAGRRVEAESGYQAILARQPNNADALHLLGVIAHQSKRHSDAAALISRAIALNGNVAPFHSNLGEVLRESGDAQTALTHYARAIELRPAYADAYNNLGRALDMLGRPNDARPMYRQAISIEPEHPKAHFNLGLVSLLLGDYATGWREYEWRWRVSDLPVGRRSLDVPPWDGSDPAGRTILVHCEQGLGDCIQFARYLPLLNGRGARIVLVCPSPLVRLFGGLPGVCVVAEGDSPPHADCRVAIGSLPLMFATTPATIPTFSAYLRPDAELTSAWRERLRPVRATGQRLIGLAWAGNPAQTEDRWRSLHLQELAAFGEVPGVRFVSLQKGSAARQLLDCPAGLDVFDLSSQLHDLADTAALVAQLDMVIAVDTSVAHLAGAVGKPVWTLVRFAADWRWALSDETTPWYSTMRLLRQETRGDWSGVVRNIANDLKLSAPIKPVVLAA